jgi:hypothetical protein
MILPVTGTLRRLLDSLPGRSISQESQSLPWEMIS